MENWKAIPGYEGLYEASDLGNIRSLTAQIEAYNRWGTKNLKTRNGRMLKQHICEPTPGYMRKTVALSKAGLSRKRLVHHLVMEAFVGPRPAGLEVAHGDRNPLNNALGNLRYATPAENTRDKVKHGTMYRGEKVGTSKLTESQARQIKDLKGKERLWQTAERFGIQQPEVSRIQNGLRWAHLL